MAQTLGQELSLVWLARASIGAQAGRLQAVVLLVRFLLVAEFRFASGLLQLLYAFQNEVLPSLVD